ncbi:MAG: tetratricopeptide repeat protein [Saprospiraceae bacterium]|nr:tetratricopeptide repeat protein [Saprospiraceae bacterium]
MQGKLKVPSAGKKRKWLIPLSIILFMAVLALLTKDLFFARNGADTKMQSIAVLPFANMSADPNQEYFADGLTEELLNLLAQVQNLQVTSRTSAFSFKGKDLSVPAIAKELSVNHVLEGSVRKSGDQVRITVQLIQATEDMHLWSNTYDRKLNNIFEVQDEIASKVVDVLEVKLLGDSAPKTMGADPQAYTLFLESRHQSGLSTMESLQRAELLIKQSITIDSTFAPSWKQLGEIYVFQTNGGIRPTTEGYLLARQAAERSLALDSTYALAHSILGIVSFYEWDFEQFNMHLTKALELDPGNSEIVLWSGIQESIAGDPYKAVQLIEKAVQLDPVTYRPLGILMTGYYYVGRCDDAIRTAREALRSNPRNPSSRATIGLCHLQQGLLKEAEAAFDEISLDWLSYTVQSMLAFAQGDTARSDEQFNQLIVQFGAFAGYQIAQINAFRNNHDKTFEWLQKAYEAKDPGLTHLRTDPIFKTVHSDPRWKPFLVKMGLNPEPWET